MFDTILKIGLVVCVPILVYQGTNDVFLTLATYMLMCFIEIGRN